MMARIWRLLGGMIGRGHSADEALDQAPSPSRDTMRMDAALSYATRLSLREQRDLLNTFGQYIWIDRDSHWYPDYISTRCYPDYGFFKIFDAVDGRFNLTIQLTTDRGIVEVELARLIERARIDVLPIVDATDVEAAEPYD